MRTLQRRRLTTGLGGKWSDSHKGKCRCPVHSDNNPSLEITEKNGTVLFVCRAGCTQSALVAALRSRGLWPERKEKKRTGTAEPQRVVATYPYVDAEGVECYQTPRFGPKRLPSMPLGRQRRRRYGTFPQTFGSCCSALPIQTCLKQSPLDGSFWSSKARRIVTKLAKLGIHATTNQGGAREPLDRAHQRIASKVPTSSSSPTTTSLGNGTPRTWLRQ